MPIAGNTPIQPGSRKPFFANLSQLDEWAGKQEEKIEGIQPFVPRDRSNDPSIASRGKVLVCHDYKGGYVESPFSRHYSFNFWSTIDAFVYFSHQRVTVPPPAWIHAAHRQDVKMLGVLLFEHEESDPDVGRVLFGSSAPSDKPYAHYTTVLAELAHQRGFDGYLLNFERALPGGNNHLRAQAARALAEWVRLLRAEMWKKVGPHAEVCWYDSIVTNGRVSYQNRWGPTYPAANMEFYFSLPPSQLNIRPASLGPPAIPSLALTQGDIYMGIDIWGRNTFGGGGFNVYRALDCISPESLGLSAALFGPGWTWEKRQDDPGRTWEKWWDEEVTLWAGEVPGMDSAKLESGYQPVGHYFNRTPPPDPAILPFFTTFSPGVGKAWWVEGEQVWNGPEGNEHPLSSGWMDLDKQCSIGDLLWPVPIVAWNGHEALSQNALPKTNVSLDLGEAWNGGNSLKISLVEPAQAGASRQKRSFWMPIQSISLTPGKDYTTSAVYKTYTTDTGTVLNFQLGFRPLHSSQDTIDIQVLSSDKNSALKKGWSGLKTTIRVADSHPSESVRLALGFMIDVEGHAPPEQQCASFSLGQINVYASDRSSQTDRGLSVKATFTSPRQDHDGVVKLHSSDDFDGVLAWDSEGSTIPSALLDRYSYWNIYVSILSQDENKGSPKWIGTTGVEYSGERAGKGRFALVGKNLTNCMQVPDAGTLRFTVQGVLETGETVKWDEVLETDVRFEVHQGK